MIDPVFSGSEEEDSEAEESDSGLEEDGEEASNGADGDEEPPQPIAGPSKPSSSKNLYRPPTLSDVDLIASSSSFSTSSSTFTLQINALLAEATPKSGSLSPVEALVVLWKKWAKKRGLPKDRGRDAHLARTVAAWVLQGGEVGGIGGERLKTRRVNGMGRGMGGWELLRAGWNFIGASFCGRSPKPRLTLSFERFRQVASVRYAAKGQERPKGRSGSRRLPAGCQRERQRLRGLDEGRCRAGTSLFEIIDRANGSYNTMLARRWQCWRTARSIDLRMFS
jgi:hypothetical protein